MALRPEFESVAKRLDATLVGVEQLTGGSSATVFALDLRTDGGTRRVVYRRYPERSFKGHEPDSVAIEFGVIEALHGVGLAVAQPLLLDTGQQFLVTEFVEGSCDVPEDRLPDALDQMVDFLTALHAIDPGELGIELRQLEEPRESSLRYLPDSAAGRLARTALGDARLVTNEPVLIHGDYWPGNVLWRGDRLAAVIDWEDAQRGDPMADLACARVELLCQYGPGAMDRFTERYLATTKVSSESLPVWEIFVSSAALATMHHWGLDAAEEARRRTHTTAFFERATRHLVASTSG